MCASITHKIRIIDLLCKVNAVGVIKETSEVMKRRSDMTKDLKEILYKNKRYQ